ncbi:MAG TPA: hypothetical protein VMW85_02075, partial [Methanomassiliicoccales archaeon]|nr:hypothetical protein [Methanomassiliicoccales archaeon]
MSANGDTDSRTNLAKIGALLIAIFMISAGFITILQITVESGSAADNYPAEYFVGYDSGSAVWQNANLGKAYMEGDWVSYQLRLDTGSKIWGASEFSIKYNFYQVSSNAIYIDGFDTSLATGFQYSTGDVLVDGTEIPGAGWGTHIPTPETGEAAGTGPTIINFMDEFDGTTDSDATPDQFRYFTVKDLSWPTATDHVIIFFRAHLSLSIIWQQDLEKILPQAMSGTEFSSWGTGTSHQGSSYATGSSRHFYLEFPGIGLKTVPIPITAYPTNVISGQKFVNLNPFDGWRISMEGKLYLWGSCENMVFIPYSSNVLTGDGPWANGYYAFDGLPKGNYTVWEEDKVGYVLVLIGRDPGLVSPYHDCVSGEDWPNPDRTTVYVDMVRGTQAEPHTQLINFYNVFGTPAIDIEKYVWNGANWEDADTATGPFLTAGPVQFMINVTNTGNVELTDVTVTDDKYGDVTVPSVLAAGESVEAMYNMEWVAGQQENSATVTGWFDALNEEVTDNDLAHYFGAAPGIDIEKYVWDGDSWEDADTVTGPYLLSGPVEFKIVITNTGNVPLNDIEVDDDMYGGVTLPGTTLAVGAHMDVEYSMAWASGQQANTAWVDGYFDDHMYSDSDMAHYFGAAPGIDIEKYVWDGDSWEDADTVTGPYLLSGPVQFKIVVTNTGNVELSDIEVTDDMYG